MNIATVLLVDDDENILQGLKRGMRNENFKILTANSADDAIETIKNISIDIVITDEKMPGMSGSQLTAYIRKNYPEILSIILSGQADLESAIKSINEGEIYRFLTKPCNVLDLIMHIRSAIEQLKLTKRIREMECIIENQKNTLIQLEKKYPGISDLKKDEKGYIIIEDD